MAAQDRKKEESKLPQGLFTLSGGDELEILRPTGVYYPIGVIGRWVTPGDGRTALNEMLSGILVLELDHLVKAAASGESYRVDPLKELGNREGWQLNTSLEEDPSKYSLVKDGTERAHQGPRLDLLLVLEVMMRCALKPFEGQKEPPSWVTRSRLVYPQLLKELKGQALFQSRS
ncbi:MAG: hypothetical protein J0I20_06250 [Chloroflexi bacterium]|nr:hypothetical protein [Chloroflexota bacterium]OJV90195.1 MAG: hypothetical protein BGO39_02190 [Chloroflexi bacterium 54-19]